MPRRRIPHVVRFAPQQDGAARHARQRERRFHTRQGGTARCALCISRPRRRLLHHRKLPHRQTAGAPRRIHAGQPAHPALSHHAGRRTRDRAAAELGHPAQAMVPQPRYRRPRGRARRAGAGVEQILLLVPRQPAGEEFRSRQERLPQPMAELRHELRALSRPRQRTRRALFRRCYSQSRASPAEGQKPRQAQRPPTTPRPPQHALSCCRPASRPSATQWSAHNVTRSATST